jgi:hypothetical protein
MAEDQDEREVDPRELLRSILHISPEDAEKVRADSPATRERGEKGDDGPTADYGDE